MYLWHNAEVKAKWTHFELIIEPSMQDVFEIIVSKELAISVKQELKPHKLAELTWQITWPAYSSELYIDVYCRIYVPHRTLLSFG